MWRSLIRERGYVVENIDATIIAQKPKMRPHIPQMEENIAERSASARIRSMSRRPRRRDLASPERRKGFLTGDLRAFQFL